MPERYRDREVDGGCCVVGGCLGKQSSSAVRVAYLPDVETEPLVANDRWIDEEETEYRRERGSDCCGCSPWKCLCGCCCFLLVIAIAVYALLGLSICALPDNMPVNIDLPQDLAKQDRQAAGKRVCPESEWNSTRPTECGARAWLSQDALDNLGDDVLPPFVERLTLVVQKIINSTMGKQASVNGFTWEAVDVSMKTINVSSSSFSFVAGKGIWVSFEGLTVEVLVDYAFQGSDVWNPLASSGQIALSVAPDSSISGLIELGVDGWGRPTVILQEPQVDIDLAMQVVSGDTSGFGLLAKIFKESFFLPFQDCIFSAVNHVIAVTAEKTIAEDLPDIISGLPWLLPLNSSCLALDLSLCSITTEEDHIEVMMRGALLDVSRPSLVYPTQPLALPDKEADRLAASMSSLAMSKWVLNSGAWVWERSNLNFLNISMKDGSAEALHNLLETVWPGLDLGLQFRVREGPKFTMTDGEVGVDARLRMGIRDFGSDREILGGSMPLGATFSVDISDEVLKIDLSRVTVPGITVDEGTCETIFGNTCVFPFNYKGKVYQQCTNEGTMFGQRYWCPTKLDAKGDFVEGSDDWGTCSATCQVVQRLVIPMINGQIEDVLRKSVHPNVDLRRPLKGSYQDVLELKNTSLSVADGAIRIWTSWSLNLHAWLNRHFRLNASRRLAATSQRQGEL